MDSRVVKTAFASTQRTATPTDAIIDNPSGASQAIVVIKPTADAGSAIFTLRGYDEVTGHEWDILASAAVSGTTPVVLRVSPHLTAATNLVAKDIVPGTLKVHAAHTGTLTYSVGVHFLE